MPSIPSVSGNFLQVPHEFIRSLVAADLTRDDLVVLLFMATKAFGFSRTPSYFTVSEIKQGTGLADEAVGIALARCCEREMLLRLSVDSDPENSHLYVVNTEDMAWLPRYEEPPAPPPEAPVAEAAVAPVAAPEAVEPAPEEGAPAHARSDPLMFRVTALVGRVMSKDELERLESLPATDAELFEAMDRLEGRRAKLYSSDQIIYEYERLMSERRRQPYPAESVPETRAQVAFQKRRTCARCGGSGYLFYRDNSVRACDCRR